MKKFEEISHQAFGEVPNHKLEEVLILISHVAPVAMFLPLHADLAILAHFLYALEIRKGRNKQGEIERGVLKENSSFRFYLAL